MLGEVTRFEFSGEDMSNHTEWHRGSIIERGSRRKSEGEFSDRCVLVRCRSAVLARCRVGYTALTCTQSPSFCSALLTVNCVVTVGSPYIKDEIDLSTETVGGREARCSNGGWCPKTIPTRSECT